ncbi:RGAP1 protein, partial [Casuarius casuarius]|nr:RGAP1 protein [Casuarius casuarius]
QGVLADLAPPAPPRVPALVVQCVAEVERRGLTEVGAAGWPPEGARGRAAALSPLSARPQMGLYRVPGTEQLVRQWKRRLLRAGGAPAGLGSVADIHVVLLVRGARPPGVGGVRGRSSRNSLPGAAADLPDEAACGAALRHAVSKLPPANRDTLAFLMLHLLRVSCSPDCRMDVLNLSRVFGPTLVGYGSANPTPLAIMEDTPRQCKVVARLLSLPPDFWRCFVEVEQEKLVLS